MSGIFGVAPLILSAARGAQPAWGDLRSPWVGREAYPTKASCATGVKP
jgi:hypothetical protein